MMDHLFNVKLDNNLKLDNSNPIIPKKIVACDGGGVKSKNCHEARRSLI
jgi:hypothetical protein